MDIYIYGYIWNYMDDQKLPRYKVWPNQPSKTHLIVGHIAIGIGSAATVYAAAARTIKRTWWRRHHKSTLHQPADANKKLEALSLFHTLSYSFHPFHIKSPTPHQPMEKKHIQDDTRWYRCINFTTGRLDSIRKTGRLDSIRKLNEMRRK